MGAVLDSTGWVWARYYPNLQEPKVYGEIADVRAGSPVSRAGSHVKVIHTGSGTVRDPGNPWVVPSQPWQ